MGRIFIRYFGLMLLLVALTGFAVAQQPPIKIGAINVLSGSFAAYGKSGRQGAQLAIEEINAAGGLLGRKLELIQVDGQAKPDVGVQEARRLILNEKVNFLIGIDSSSVALAVAPLTNEYKIPLVVMHGATPGAHRTMQSLRVPHLQQRPHGRLRGRRPGRQVALQALGQHRAGLRVRAFVVERLHRPPEGKEARRGGGGRTVAQGRRKQLHAVHHGAGAATAGSGVLRALGRRLGHLRPPSQRFRVFQTDQAV